MQGISIIIPCYNREDSIAASIESAVSQEYDGPLEVIVSDDGSTDKSVMFSKQFGGSVRVIRKPADCKLQGAGATRNRGIVASRYPLIAFLDSDDLFLPGHLKAVGEAIHQEPNVGIVFDDSLGIDKKSGARWKRPYGKGEYITPETLLLDPFIPTNAILTRRAVLDKVGLFDETLLIAQDYDLWLRIAERYPVKHVEHLGSAYVEHVGRETNNKSKQWQYSTLVVERAVKRYPYKRSVVRKRRAVLAFRIGQCAITQKQYLKSIRKFAEAAIRDPLRALKMVAAALKKIPSR